MGRYRVTLEIDDIDEDEIFGLTNAINILIEEATEYGAFSSAMLTLSKLEEIHMI